MKISQRELVLGLITGGVVLFGVTALLARPKLEVWKELTADQKKVQFQIEQDRQTIASRPTGRSGPVRQERHELMRRLIGGKCPGVIPPAENRIRFCPADVCCPPHPEHRDTGKPRNSLTESETQRNHAENGCRHQSRTRSQGITALQEEILSQGNYAQGRKPEHTSGVGLAVVIHREPTPDQKSVTERREEPSTAAGLHDGRCSTSRALCRRGTWH